MLLADVLIQIVGWVNREWKCAIIQAVFPDAALKRLPAGVLQRARCPRSIDVAALQRILETPRLIQELWLEESCESRVCSISQERRLIGLVQIFPVAARFQVFLLIGCVVQARRNLRDAVVVVAILKRARDTSSHCAEALVIKILDGDIL